MIKKFVKRFEASEETLREVFRKEHPEDYRDIVKHVVQVLHDDSYGSISPDLIHEINDGSYQGTLLYVIGSGEYQPSDYWYVKVGYGSCSACDTLQCIRDYSEEKPTEQQVNDYMTLALHIVQSLKKMSEDTV